MDQKDKNIAIWDKIYSENFAGSNLEYPCSNLVSIFYQNISSIKLGTCLDHGFGSANNSAFLIEHFDNFYGTEISDSCLEIAQKKLSKFPNYCQENFIKSDSLELLQNKFDVVISWGVLGYNNTSNFRKTIEQIYDSLRVGGFLFATIPSVGDTKAKNKISGNKNEYLIKSEIAQQEGAVIFATDIDGDFLEQFDMFSVKDYGFFERKSLSRDINFSENYVVAEKK